jgi:uncharacterized membrane protein
MHKKINSRFDFAVLFIVLIMIVYFLYNTGFIFELTNEDGRSSISLSLNYLKHTSDIGTKSALYSSYYTPQDVFSAEWLHSHLTSATLIYCDRYSTSLALSAYGTYDLPNKEIYLLNGTSPQQNSCIYLSHMNIAEGFMVNLDPDPEYRGPYRGEVTYPTAQIEHLLFCQNEIYSNGGSEIYYKPS